MSANFTTDLALKDEILPMDELFKYGDQKAGDFLQKEFWPAMHKNAQVMGTTYAIPFHNSTPILYYNKTMFDQAGIKQPPQTWAELLADAKKLTDESKGQWGSCCRRPTTTTAAGSSRRWYAPTAGNTLTKTIWRGLLQLADRHRRPALLAGSDLQGQGNAVRGAELEADQRRVLLR